MCSRRERRRVARRCKKGVSRDRYKKKKMTVPKGRARLSFSPGPRATTVKRRNFRNSTSRRLSIPRPSSRYDAFAESLPGERSERRGGNEGGNRGNEGLPWSFSVNFLQLMKEHTRLPLPRQNTQP